MIQNEVFYKQDAIDEDGRDFLTQRGLSIPVALKSGVASRDGYIYFAYKVNGEIVRTKRRCLTNKKDQKYNPLPEEQKDSFKFPFWNAQIWPRNDYLIITEGEFDCLAILALTGSNCVSLPNGASSIESTIKNNYPYLQSFQEIYIATDMDGPGEEAATKAMALIPPQKYRRLTFPAKDANEWLRENPHSDLGDLHHLMRNAKRIETKAITPMHSLPLSFYEELQPGISFGWQSLDMILTGIRPGEVTVITADTGSGKTTFCINLAFNIAELGHSFWINSFEMKAETVNRKLASCVLQTNLRTRAFLKEEMQIYLSWQKSHPAFINLENNIPSLQTLKKYFEIVSLAYDTKYIFIDHFDYIHATGSRSTLENIDDAIRELHMLAIEFNVHVFLVVHPKNVQTNLELQMSDLKGSSAIKQYADNIIILSRLDRFDAKEINKVKVKIVKNRQFGIEDSFTLNYNPHTDTFFE